ncbi:MAG TPA: apolipoprotein N-acyltransferase [Polyangiaceae bacterium]|nr:apolipoprotein N-acyltransferase [Polyangiaceae bacterium]
MRTTPLRPAHALAAAALSGVLSALAYPTLGLWPLAWVALSPLYIGVRHQPLRWRLACGWLSGTFTVALGSYWLPAAYRHISDDSALNAAGLHALFCAWHGLEGVLLVLIAAGLSAAQLPLSLSWALAHVAAELCLPRVLPYTYAATLSAVPWALQSLALLGPSSVVFLLAGTHAALGEAWLQRARLFRDGAPRRALACWGLLWAAQLGYGALSALQLQHTLQRSRSLSAGIVQANTAPFVKRDTPDDSLQAHLRLSRELLKRERPDVLVWSETALATPLPSNLLSAALMRRLGGGLGVPVLLGAVVRETTPEGDAQYNSVLSVAADGFVCPSCRYDKRTLLPLIEDTQRGGARAFEPGSSLGLLPVAGHSVAPLVCFEATSSAALRELMSQGDASWLVNLANDGWFGDSPEPAFHLALARLRAIEQQRYLVRATTTGISAVIAPDGALVASAGSGEASFTARIFLLSGSTLYQRVGATPWWAALLTAALWGAREALRSRRGSR